jgi:uncharacterized membrane-anchored protein
LRNKRIILLLAAAIIIQIAILFSMVVLQNIRLASGRHIIVKTVPIDPRSLFRGDFIKLNYEFSRISFDRIKSAEKYFYPGDKIFVKLAQVAEQWGIVSASDKPLKAEKPNEVVILGVVQRVSGWGKDKFVEIEYGIESYFLPEGRGRYIEQEISQKRVKVELSVDKKGYASVYRLFIDDKEVKFQ